ncbi:50S ribosomal protein L23 [Candidatus Uhrbacteria bacterium]|nr:50S ribosomal protein L23 [Candidatus Uhrbacteria bacterium]
MAWFKKGKKEEVKTEIATVEKAVPVLKSGKVASDVILKPMVTEKAAHLAAKGQYVFAVSPRATKVQVKNAIRTMYGMTPVSVNMQVVEGKAVRFGRSIGKRKNWKKAIVTLPEGKKIEVYEGV